MYIVFTFITAYRSNTRSLWGMYVLDGCITTILLGLAIWFAISYHQLLYTQKNIAGPIFLVLMFGWISLWFLRFTDTDPPTMDYERLETVAESKPLTNKNKRHRDPPPVPKNNPATALAAASELPKGDPVNGRDSESAPVHDVYDSSV
jgi:hypothetical protein